MEMAARNIGAIPRDFEALMFAIYSTAIMSLSDHECNQRLGEARKSLLSRYVSCTKVALSRTRFMGTTSLVVLQALVLHLHSVRDTHEPRAVWSLTGVAVRIAQGMGLDRDGALLGLPPFETEIRRRIWWLLKTHDFRTAELCGVDKFRDIRVDAESSKWPTNANDDQLRPGMPSLENGPDKLTDAVFISVKCELFKLAIGRGDHLRRAGLTPSELCATGSDAENTDQSFAKIEELLETRYLRYCDPSQPLHLMTMLLARSAMNFIRFLIHHPRRWANVDQTPVIERQAVWDLSIKILEQHSMLQSNPMLKQFAWYAPYFQQWHAVIHVLDTLRASPDTAGTEKAWNLVASTYENNPHMILDTRKPIHIAVGSLCLKAYASREAVLQKSGTSPSPLPTFIVQLRQQRKIVQTKKQAVHSKSYQQEDPVDGSQSATQLPNWSRPSGLPNSSGSPEGDAFWSKQVSGDAEFGIANDLGDMGWDFLQDQDGVGDSATSGIDWDKWDSWLAESNMIRPYSSENGFFEDM
ncbi:uncharacterized protein JN550_009549 [Neoarthrinium moseri]|uniref:uncharacterized protein n=1 Tax=Neoarthrinium moseri TaxID=1658444 RepID=UPI001FDC7221|nr:uncharacterized protein JN550_009549 [Neoarthrinium moseri]KAI1863438.1 hypothetical protein JN550_009549 [Neoarthrinium moseri]